jgi:hypothetical protein
LGSHVGDFDEMVEKVSEVGGTIRNWRSKLFDLIGC